MTPGLVNLAYVKGNFSARYVYVCTCQLGRTVVVVVAVYAAFLDGLGQLEIILPALGVLRHPRVFLCLV